MCSFLERGETPFELLPHRLEIGIGGIAAHRHRLADGKTDGGKRSWNLRAVPASQCPAGRRLQVERQERIPGGFGEPDGARLRHTRRAARTIQRETDRLSPPYVAHELEHRFAGVARRGSP